MLFRYGFQAYPIEYHDSAGVFRGRTIDPNSASSTGRGRVIGAVRDLQSLGENCELGLVQRIGGAEPLGLFRWASTPLRNLLAALDARFDGLGAADSLAIEMDGASEFQVLDRRFGFRNHSFAFHNAGARREDILKREMARLPYMARMMIEDLEAAEKLFCFHDAGRSGREGIEQLVAALERYGPNSLLWVRLAQRAEQVGTAERVGERLIEGYIDRFQPLHDVKTPSVAAWMGVVRAAHGIWRGMSGVARATRMSLS